MLFSSLLTLGYFLVVNGNEVGTGECPNVKTSLSFIRKRRHLAFPDGSDVVITIDSAKAFLTHVPSGWMMTMDLDVLFPLPNANFTAAHARRKLHHMQKRNIWTRLRDAVNMHNVNGHACILRSICEARTHLAPRGQSLVHDILRSIFTAPSLEKEFEEEMGQSFHEVLDSGLCERIHECPFSILNFMLDLNRPK